MSDARQAAKLGLFTRLRPKRAMASERVNGVVQILFAIRKINFRKKIGCPDISKNKEAAPQLERLLIQYLGWFETNQEPISVEPSVCGLQKRCQG